MRAFNKGDRKSSPARKTKTRNLATHHVPGMARIEIHPIFDLLCMAEWSIKGNSFLVKAENPGDPGLEAGVFFRNHSGTQSPQRAGSQQCPKPGNRNQSGSRVTSYYQGSSMLRDIWNVGILE